MVGIGTWSTGMISSTSTWRHCGLERHKNLEQLWISEQYKDWDETNLGRIRYISMCWFWIYAGVYLLKAVRVLTAVFWAAALVLGLPCTNIDTLLCPPIIIRTIYWPRKPKQNGALRWKGLLSITCDSSWQSVTRLRQTCNLKQRL